MAYLVTKGLENRLKTSKNIAKNLPSDITLLVKEHPMAVGYRPKSYYQEINNIENVQIVGPLENLSEIIKNAKMLITISGTSAFEAILRKIPVIHFGDLPFEVLNDNMIKKVDNFENLKDSYHLLLKNYQYNEPEIVRYIQSCIRKSVPLDFYSLFLKKAEIRINDRQVELEKQKQLSYLENYISCRFK